MIALAGKTLLESEFANPPGGQTRHNLKFRTAPGAGKELRLHVEKKGQGVLHYGARLLYAPRQALPPG